MKFETKAYEEKMKKSVESYQSELVTVRVGRANAGVLSRVNFEYYGAPTPLVSMADVRVTDAKTLTVTPYDASTLKAMEKAILASDVGITPMNDGRVLRLSFPQPTEEKRRELQKTVSGMGEEAKIAIRNIRRVAVDDAKKQKKDNLLTEDEEKAAEKSVQDLTDKYVKMLDDITSAKQKEIMEI